MTEKEFFISNPIQEYLAFCFYIFAYNVRKFSIMLRILIMMEMVRNSRSSKNGKKSYLTEKQ